jgi:hypothetical protein
MWHAPPVPTLPIQPSIEHSLGSVPSTYSDSAVDPVSPRYFRTTLRFFRGTPRQYRGPLVRHDTVAPKYVYHPKTLSTEAYTRIYRLLYGDSRYLPL